MKKILIVACLFSWTLHLGAQLPEDFQKIVILQPTGEEQHGLPEMVTLSDTAQLYQAALRIINNSFIREAVDLYFLAQVYLYNVGDRTAIEPAYLALTQNQGGFARFGFYLKGQGPKPNTPYIDIIDKTVDAPQDKLMSFTQLYPHEMGHVIYRLLSSDSTLEETSRNVDMHYFSIITDYGIAFNEGFAEHIENAARFHEPNDSIREGIFADIKQKQATAGQMASAFERDFHLPLRLGYYKATMIMWYQQLEDLKRYEQAVSGAVKYHAARLKKGSVEDRLTFRNSGVRIDSSGRRNYVQLLATEGFISSFFTHLLRSDLPEHYLQPEFYQPFFYDSTQLSGQLRDWFSPLQNQFLKYFYVLHELVTVEHSSRAQFIDFFEGYQQAFPSEAARLEELFFEASGTAYSATLPPQLWLMVKGHEHRLLALDAFGAITIPVYTFDLNAAEVEDLISIKGLGEDDALLIVDHRNQNGFFGSLDAAAAIPGLSEAARKALLDSNFDQAYFDSLPEPALNITALITTPLKKLALRSLPYFTVLLLLMLYLFREKTLKKRVLLTLAYLATWLLFVAAGLGSVILPGNPLLLFLPFLLLFLAAIALVPGKRSLKERWRPLSLIGLMGVFVVYNLL